MTYRYQKKAKGIKAGWIGFCDSCEKCFVPIVLNVTMTTDKNILKEHMKINFMTTKRVFRGFCENCCIDDGDDNPGFNILNNVERGKVKYVRKFRGVKIV